SASIEAQVWRRFIGGDSRNPAGSRRSSLFRMSICRQLICSSHLYTGFLQWQPSGGPATSVCLGLGDRMDWLAIVSGFGIGAIVGMTGVGGGSLMTPLLIGVFRLHPAV